MSDRKIAILVLDTDLSTFDTNTVIGQILNAGLPPGTVGRLTVFEGDQTDSVEAIEAALRDGRPVIFKRQGS